MTYDSLGERIAGFRNDKGLTQSQLAEKIRVSRSIIVKIENSQRVVSLDEGEAISKIFAISLDTLLDFEKRDSEEMNFASALIGEENCSQEQEKEIKRFEMLFDALCIQQIIYQGE